MARLTTDRQLYYGVESTEGVDPYAASNPPGANAIAFTHLKVSPDVAFHARGFVGQFGAYQGKPGQQADPMLMFTVDCRGGAASTSIVPSIDPLLSTVFGYIASPLTNASSRVQDNGAGTLTGGDSTSTNLHVTSSTGYSVGNAVAVETNNASGVYEVGWISAIPDGTHITLGQQLSGAVVLANLSRVDPSVTYKPANSGHGSIAFQIYLDGTNRLSFVGCKGSLKFDAASATGNPTLTFLWRAIDWLDTPSVARPTPAYDTATPPTSNKFKIDSTSLTLPKLVSWDLRQGVARKRAHYSTYGTFSEVVAARDLVGFIQAYDVDESQFSGWSAGTEQVVSHQFGNQQYNMVAYQIPKAQRMAVEYGDDNTSTTDEIYFEGNIGAGADELRLAFL